MQPFINDIDYSVVVGEQAMRVITQASASVRIAAESEAIEEIASYLRPKYDTDNIFSAQGELRNRLIVMYTCDIALYHMTASVPQKMGSEVREKRYKDAIKWLEGVAEGKIVPNLPLATDGDGNPTGFAVVAGSQPPLNHSW